MSTLNNISYKRTEKEWKRGLLEFQWVGVNGDGREVGLDDKGKNWKLKRRRVGTEVFVGFSSFIVSKGDTENFVHKSKPDQPHESSTHGIVTTTKEVPRHLLLPTLFSVVPPSLNPEWGPSLWRTDTAESVQ